MVVVVYYDGNGRGVVAELVDVSGGCEMGLMFQVDARWKGEETTIKENEIQIWFVRSRLVLDIKIKR